MRTIREIVNFLLLRGNLGRAGAGVCPVRGHSNVQAPDHGLSGNGRRKRGWMRFATSFGFEAALSSGPRRRPVHRRDAGRRCRLFMAVGAIRLRRPGHRGHQAALRRCRLTVQVSTNLEPLTRGDGSEALILPTSRRTEIDRQPGGAQFVTVEDSIASSTPRAAG